MVEIKELVNLGTYTNKRGKFLITDPCYLSRSHFIDTLTVKKGVWKTAIVTTVCKDWGYRIGCLLIYHEFYMNPSKNPSKIISLEDLWAIQWHPDDLGASVDSGMAGFFEKLPLNKDKQYEECCGITLSDTGAGIVSNGIVSHTGLGDGSYPCYSRHNKKGEAEIAVLDYLDLVPIMAERKKLDRAFKKGEIALHINDIEQDENKEYVERLLKSKSK